MYTSILDGYNEGRSLSCDKPFKPFIEEVLDVRVIDARIEVVDIHTNQYDSNEVKSHGRRYIYLAAVGKSWRGRRASPAVTSTISPPMNWNIAKVAHVLIFRSASGSNKLLRLRLWYTIWQECDRQYQGYRHRRIDDTDRHHCGRSLWSYIHERVQSLPNFSESS